MITCSTALGSMFSVRSCSSNGASTGRRPRNSRLIGIPKSWRRLSLVAGCMPVSMRIAPGRRMANGVGEAL